MPFFPLPRTFSFEWGYSTSNHNHNDNDNDNNNNNNENNDPSTARDIETSTIPISQEESNKISSSSEEIKHLQPDLEAPMPKSEYMTFKRHRDIPSGGAFSLKESSPVGRGGGGGGSVVGSEEEYEPSPYARLLAKENAARAEMLSGGNGDSLSALNSLLEASYSQGYFDAFHSPSSYLIDPNPNCDSEFPDSSTTNTPPKHSLLKRQGIRDFAATYPMTFIAGLGVLAGLNFILAAQATMYLRRRLLGSAARSFESSGSGSGSGSVSGMGGTPLKGSLWNGSGRSPQDIMIDDLERRITERMLAQTAEMRGLQSDFKSEIIKILRNSNVNKPPQVAVPGVKLGKGSIGIGIGNGGDNGLGGKIDSPNAPVASKVEEARLSQIVTEALEGAWNDRMKIIGLGAGVSVKGDDQVVGKSVLDELKEVKRSIKDLSEVVKSLNRSMPSASSSPPSGLSATVSGDPNIMTMGDIASAVKALQDANKSSLGTTAPSDIDPTPVLAEAVQAASKADSISKDNLPEKVFAATSSVITSSDSPSPAEPKTSTSKLRLSTSEARAQAQISANQAANAAYQDRVEAELHLDPTEKANRLKERGDIATRMKLQAEEHALKMKELMSKAFETGSGAPEAKVYQKTRWAGLERLRSTSKDDVEERIKGEETDRGSGSSWPGGGRVAGLRGSESAAKPITSSSTTNSATTEKARSVPTQGMKVDPPVMNKKEEPSSSTLQQPKKAVYGVDDSGDWSFTLVIPPPSTPGWKTVPIVLRKMKATANSYGDATSGWQAWSGSSSQSAYSTRAKIFFNRDLYPDMVEVDGSMFRCIKESGMYSIKEQISQGD